jgi:hypothetical protein
MNTIPLQWIIVAGVVVIALLALAVMLKRGYPMGDFERRARPISQSTTPPSWRITGRRRRSRRTMSHMKGTTATLRPDILKDSMNPSRSARSAIQFRDEQRPDPCPDLGKITNTGLLALVRGLFVEIGGAESALARGSLADGGVILAKQALSG